MSIKRCSVLKLTGLIASYYLFSSSVSSGQVALTLSSGAASPGATVELNLSLTSRGTRPAALQWTFAFSNSEFTAITAVPSPSATSASKKLQCNGTAGSYVCALYGINANIIPDGVVATVTLTLSSGKKPSRTIAVTNVVSASLTGSRLVSFGIGSAVTAHGGARTSALSRRLICAPSSVTGSGTSICTVVLNGAAPTGGAVVALSDNSTFVTTPAYVTIPAGASTANFTASIAPVSADSTAVITASLNGTTANTSVSLIVPAVPATLSCAPATLRSSFNGTCTVTLNKAAPSAGLLVTISDNSAALTVPASVTVAAGSTTATFAAYAGTVSATRSSLSLSPRTWFPSPLLSASLQYCFRSLS